MMKNKKSRLRAFARTRAKKSRLRAFARMQAKKIKTKNWGKTQIILMTGHDDQKKQVKNFR